MFERSRAVEKKKQLCILMRGNFVRQYRCYDLSALVALHEPTLAEEHRNIQNKVLKVADLDATVVLLVN